MCGCTHLQTFVLSDMTNSCVFIKVVNCVPQIWRFDLKNTWLFCAISFMSCVWELFCYIVDECLHNKDMVPKLRAQIGMGQAANQLDLIHKLADGARNLQPKKMGMVKPDVLISPNHHRM